MIYVIGIGLDINSHITSEAKRAIRTCSTLYALIPDAEAIKDLRKENPLAKIVDCNSFYNLHERRPDVYDSIADALIKEATPYTDIGLVVYGHPMFLVSAVEKMLLRAHQKNLSTKIIPGISSFDAILADLKIDLGYGVIIADATLLIKRRLSIIPQLPLLIFQVANIGSDYVERTSISNERLHQLTSYLQLTYPSDHQCKLVVSQKSIFEQSYIITDSLSNLAVRPDVSLSDRPTLYVPALVE